MSNLINFTFENATVRTALKGNEPYFCLSDVTNILAVNRRSSEAFNLDEKGVIKLATPTKGGTQEITFINEPNLYRVIFRSNKAEAVKFQNWVFDEVLPSIRKTGQYRHTISETQAHAISKAVKQKCQHNSHHYQTLYHALYDEFGITSYKELLASDFDGAMAFIGSYQFTDNNALWRLIGILEYERMQSELDKLRQELDSVCQKLHHLSRSTGLIYDALEQQRTNSNQHLLADAKAFIKRHIV